jgi:preprotein translocase subunit SecD
LRVGRYFLALLLLLVALYSLIVFPGQRHKPKLGIDLVGGLRVVFTAITPQGLPAPSSDQMSQARQIMEDRINTYGVTGATVVVQGSDQLVIEIPSGTGADVKRLGQAAVLNFRGVMAPAQPVTCSNKAAKPTPTSSTSASSTSTAPSPSGSGASAGSGSATKTTDADRHRRLAPSKSRSPKVEPSGSGKASGSGTAGGSAASTPSGSATGSPTSSASATPTVSKCTSDPFAAVVAQDSSLKTLLDQSPSNTGALNAEECPSPSMPSVNGTTAPCHAWKDLTATQQSEITNALHNYNCKAAQAEPDIATSYYIACDQSGTFAYLLGHVVVKGSQISSASAQAPNVGAVGGNTQWTVSLTLGGSGADAWHAWTSKYNYPQGASANVSPQQVGSTAPCGPSATLPCSDFVAFTLDGQVITSPVTVAALSRQTSISGSFTQDSANALAKELNYGKLPISFRAEENRKVSATLGSTQLHAAFIAGGIGLALVILYSLLYYRALGFVTIGSLIVSALLTYAMLVILSSQIGFTLDLAGIAGFIVALGITADSFVVFFERIKDEVHEGRSMRVAVPRAWVRARRTILSADTVSFLAAAILYYFAAADVKGFAFTLGMSTILDLIVVFLFTHPLVSVLSRSTSFGSARFSGLGSVRAGGIATGDDEPPVARRRPARSWRAAGGQKASGVAVLDEEDADAEQTAAVADEPAGAEDMDQPEEPDSPPQPRRRTTPQGGTAAERAAARRARMRDQGGDGKEKR